MDKLDLCDASSLEWEQGWEALFDSAAGEEAAKTREKFASSNQLQEERWEIWDGPSPQQVCSVKSGNPWPKSSPPSSSDFIISDNRGQLAGGTSCLKFFCRLTHSLAVGSPRMLEHLADESRVSNLFMALFATLLRKEMLVWWTLLGVAAGVGLGASLYNSNCSSLTIDLIGYPGELYLRALQQLVLPLVVSSLMSGVFSLRQAGGGWSLLYYILSMLLAVLLGMTLFYVIKPGKSLPFVSSSLPGCANLNSPDPGAEDNEAAAAAAQAFLNIGRKLIPTNIVAEPNYLGIVAFATVFAFCCNTVGERAYPLVTLVELCNSVVIKIILGVIAFTPFGVASLACKTLLKACNVFHLLKALGVDVGTVIGGFLLHSLAVLPLTEKSFQAPHAHGLELNLAKLFVLAIASTLAAIGCASVPQAGVITAVGFSRYVGDVSVLLAVDWLLGSIRTSVNIWEMAVLA
ncbi:hypothetical protein SELMODRAFT_430694 [Selaginella moellendorffii]|uniref:Amino acid transporter n=1 Tax=Selaginella moellendorffii TaxID=88036 RepID=D8TA70_SELML|nr:hypothetical protein SELMODRAFT_430694 [Selaginella moellendorffii]